MEYTIAAYTDVGTVKKTNQDSFCVRRAALPEGGEIALVVVCDGMGGLSRGELASAEAVRAFGAWFDGSMERLPALCARDFGAVRQQWEDLIQNLHSRLLAYARSCQIQLGTTLVAWLTAGGRYLAVSVGDSRLYEYGARLRQVTQDQSLVAREIALGRITEEQALHHPQRNVLLQCLGAGGTVSPVFQEGRVSGGALYLLCSDGLVHEVGRAELEERLLPIRLDTKEQMTRTLAGLVEDCKARGEGDNITAVLVKAAESPLAAPRRGLRGLLSRMGKKTDDPGRMPRAVLVETAQIVYTQERIG